MAIEDLREIGNVLYERRSDGMLYPVRRVRPDTEARGVPAQNPSLLNVGGIGQRLGLLNQIFNPVEAIGQSMQAGQRLTAPNMGVMDRVAALGDMLSGVAGVTGPAVVAGRAGAPAAAAVMEGLLGGSPTTQAAGDTMRAAGRDVVERLNQPGQMPTVYSNPIPGVGRGEAIDDALRAKYPGAKISVTGDASKGYTLNRIDVPKSQRNSGIGTQIMRDLVDAVDAQGATLKLSPSGDFGGSVPRLKEFYKRFGFIENKGKAKDFGISESMYRLPQSSPAPTLPSPRTEAEAMARDILQLRAEGRADEVTEPMMLAADPQYMYMNTPLPMDYASRMARAEARGFAPTLHGTGSDISAVDEKFFGSGRDALGSGFYTTTNATRANVYAPKVKGPSIEASKEFADGANVMPLAVRMDRPFDLSEVTGRAADEIGSAAGQDPYFTYRSGESGAYIQGDEGQSAFLDPYHPRYQTLSRLREGFGPHLTSSLLSDAGYSGVVGPEASGNLVRVSFNPQDIRSRFARFDPAFAHLRNLSAALAAGVPIGLLAMQPNEEQY
jgi:GNAT superfamily N-acetyltransferase